MDNQAPHRHDARGSYRHPAKIEPR